MAVEREEFLECIHSLKTDLEYLKLKLDNLNRPDSVEYFATIDIVQASRMLKVTQQCIYNWVYADKIPYIKINGRLLFNRADIESLMLERRRNGKG